MKGRISRFARNTLSTLTYVRHLQNLGVDIVFETNNIDTRIAYSEMILTVLAGFSQEESRSISENTKWSIRKRYEDGIVRWCTIYGYKKVEGKGEYTIDPQEAAVVRLIFKTYEHGSSVDEVIRMLESKGIKSPNGKETWTRAQVGNLLKNEKYVGDLQMQKYYTTDHISHKAVRNDGSEIKTFYIKNHHEGIVERRIFDRVQAIAAMKNCRTNGPVQYPFGSIMTCPQCGKPLRQKFIPVQNRRKGAGWCCEEGCGNFIIRGYLVEEAVLKAYSDISPETVRMKVETAKNTRRKRAAELMLKYKTELPEMERVDFYWVDDLIDHITFGQHSLTTKVILEQIRESRETVEDRTISVFWKCGLKTTLTSGVFKDCDNPVYLAGLMREYYMRHPEERAAVM